MRYKKILGSIAALALAVTAFAGFATTANAEAVSYELSQSASGQKDTQTRVLNLKDSTEKKNVTFNANSGNWKGVALLEFEIPATDPQYVTSVKLDVSLHNMGTRGGTRTYDLTAANAITLSDATTCDNVLGTNGTVLYTGAALADGGYRNDSITSDELTAYVKGKINKDSAVTVQLAFTNAAQMFEIYTAVDSNVTAIETKVPTLTLDISDTVVVERTVTVNCVDEENNNLKTSTEKVIDGETFTPKYDASFNQDGFKYTYKSGAEAKEITDDTTITLVYSKRELAKTTITLNAKYGELTEEISKTAAVEDTIYKIPYSKYAIKNGILYSIAQEKYASKVYFAHQKAGTQEDQTLTAEYTASELKPIYFTEGEAFGSSEADNQDIRCSGGACYKVPAKGVEVTTLKAGKYVIEAAVWGVSGGTYTITAGDTTLAIATTGSVAGDKTAEFELTEDTVVKVTGNEKNKTGLDYILITGEETTAAAIEVGINSAVAGAAEVGAPTTATAIVDGKLSGEAVTIDTAGKTVTTVYVKVANPVAGTMPTVTFNGTDYKASYVYEANGGSYYVYQFVDTAAGAEDVSKVAYGEAVWTK